MHPDATRLTPVAAPPDDTQATRGTRPDLAGLPDLDPPAGFELLEVVGKGGMGVVFRAREKAFDREVAVKFLLGDPPDPALTVRFLDEARITGQLQHPGIPAAYRTGLLADGRPYLAMKLIKGRTLDALLAERGTGSTRWLGVFEGIAQAVGYAHAHGVLHRDLKPANVMVGAFGEVQVMDWGLAKVFVGTGGDVGGEPPSDPLATTIQSLRDADDRTQAGSVMGTPAYMPPEQAGGDVGALGPPADVFGLGGILCALLTGRPPYVGPNARTTLDMAVRGDLTDAFIRLDTCGAEPELIALCQRCLSATPAGRPPDGSAVAAAVAALRTAADDRAKRAEMDKAKAEVEVSAQRKRRRLQLVGGGLLVGVLAVGMVGTGVGYVQAEQSRVQADQARGSEKERADGEAKARKEADDAKELAETRRVAAERATELAKAETKRANLETEWAQVTLEFLVNDLIRQADSYAQADGAAVNPNLTIREALDRAAGRIDARTKDRPWIAPALRGPIGQSYLAVGQTKKGIDQLERAVGESEKHRGAGDRHTLDLRRTLANAYQNDSQFDKALAHFADVRKRQADAFGADNAETLWTELLHAQTLRLSGKGADALKMIEGTAERAEGAFGRQDGLTLAVRVELAAVHLSLDKLDRAAEVYADLLARHRTAYGDAHPSTLNVVAWFGWCHILNRQPEKAVPLFEEAVTGRKKALGPEHPHTLLSIDNLGNAYAAVGRAEEGIPLLEEAYAGRKKVLGPTNLKTFWSVNSLANAYTLAGRWGDARRLYLDGAALMKEAFGPDAPNRLSLIANLANCDLMVAQPRRALAVLTDLIPMAEKRFGPNHQNVSINKANLATALLDLGRPDEAAKPAAEAADGLAKRFTEVSHVTVEARLLQAECDRLTGRPAEAKKRVLGLLPAGREALPVRRFPLAVQLSAAGKMLLALDTAADAEPVLREAVAVLEKDQPKAWETARAKSLLGGALLAQKKYADAEPLLLAGLDGLTKAEKWIPPREVNERREAAVRLVELYTAWGKRDKAAEWRVKTPAEVLPVPRLE